MNDNEMKIVDFAQYCKTCKYKEYREEETPCCDCISEPMNLNSHKPVLYEEAKR